MHDIVRDFFIWLTAFLSISAGLYLFSRRVAGKWRKRRESAAQTSTSQSQPV
jgi:hypothetical protein